MSLAGPVGASFARCGPSMRTPTRFLPPSAGFVRPSPRDAVRPAG